MISLSLAKDNLQCIAARQSPVILITAKLRVSQPERLVALEVAAIFAKPFALCSLPLRVG